MSLTDELDRYEATFDIEYLQWADRLQQKQIELFWDSANGGFFSTAADAPDLILRLKDGAFPFGAPESLPADGSRTRFPRAVNKRHLCEQSIPTRHDTL
jgi:hypothetical protein